MLTLIQNCRQKIYCTKGWNGFQCPTCCFPTSVLAQLLQRNPSLQWFITLHNAFEHKSHHAHVMWKMTLCFNWEVIWSAPLGLKGLCNWPVFHSIFYKVRAILNLFLSWQHCLLATKPHSNSITTHSWHHISGDESLLVENPLWLTAQRTGKDSPCDVLLTRGPRFAPTERIDCNGTLYEKSFHYTLYVCLFYHLWLYGCRVGFCLCLENRAMETSLHVSSFCF